MAKGLAEGRATLAEERARHIQTYADSVLSLAEIAGSVEKAFQILKIPDDCIDEVRAKVLGHRPYLTDGNLTAPYPLSGFRPE